LERRELSGEAEKRRDKQKKRGEKAEREENGGGNFPVGDVAAIFDRELIIPPRHESVPTKGLPTPSV
jgi:hypothetical protein